MAKWRPHPPKRCQEQLSPGVHQEERADEAEEVLRGHSDEGGATKADGTAAGLAGGDSKELVYLSDSFEDGPHLRSSSSGGQEAPGSPWWGGGVAESALPRDQTNLGGAVEVGTAWISGGQPHSAAEPAVGGALHRDSIPSESAEPSSFPSRLHGEGEHESGTIAPYEDDPAMRSMSDMLDSMEERMLSQSRSADPRTAAALLRAADEANAPSAEVRRLHHLALSQSAGLTNFLRPDAHPLQS